MRTQASQASSEAPPSQSYLGLSRSERGGLSDGGVRRVLLVDAGGERQGALQRITASHAAVVHHARSAAEAFGYALKFSYDVLVVDPSLEAESPLLFLEQLVTLQDSCAVLLSGRWPALPEGFSLGGRLVGSLISPWDDEEVSEAVRRGIELCHARRAPSAVFPHSSGDGWSLLLLGRSGDLELLEALLPGSTIAFASSLDDASVRLAERSFDAVLTELSLPDACGLDAVLRLRRVAAQTPVLVFSEALPEALADQALAAGAQEVLVKTRVVARRVCRALRSAVQRQRALSVIHHGVLHDELTNLAKRALLQQRISNALARSRRIGNTFALVYVDLDHFKWINDTHGHHVGDAVLIAVSERLCGAVREYDTVARLGGDEFAILLDTLDDPAEAEVVAQRVLASLSRPIEVARHELSVTASLGVSVFPDGGVDAADLLRHADQAMYCAKRAGRNTYSLTPVVEDAALARPASLRPPSLRCLAAGR